MPATKEADKSRVPVFKRIENFHQLWANKTKMPADFTIFGIEHLFWLSLAVLTTILLIRSGRRGDDAWKNRLGKWLAWLPPLAFTIPTFWVGPATNWDLSLVIPLHLCYFLAYLTPVLLVRKNSFIFEVAYFWVAAGCSQALFTPDVGAPFPAAQSLRYWMVHITLLQCFLYAVLVFKMRPRMRDILKSLLWMDIYIVVVGLLNYPLGTNYLYLREKPPVPTMMDYLGDFPWFLLTGQVVALILFFIVYLPFWVGDLKKQEVRPKA